MTGGATAKSAGAFFFGLTLLVVGVVSIVSVILSVRGLWSLRRGKRVMRPADALPPVSDPTPIPQGVRQ